MARFTGKAAIVTGAGSGIGRATALRLGAEDAIVACVDIVADGSERTAADIIEAGGTAKSYRCDVSDQKSVISAVDATVRELGPPRVVCNVAGIGTFAHSHEQPLEEWRRIIDVNLTGTFLVTQVCLPHLLEHGGNIVNTTSTAGLVGQPYCAAYAASKGGVVMLTKALAREYVERGIRVNAVAPSNIETPIFASFGFPEDISPRLFERMMPLIGFGVPEDVAALITFLASDDAHYITGVIVPVDGGITS